MISTCAFCQREGVKTRGHHVVPRCKGGREIAPTCQTCEDFIHKTWSHNELRDTYNTVEAIQATDTFKEFLRWLRRQPISVYYRSARGNLRASADQLVIDCWGTIERFALVLAERETMTEAEAERTMRRLFRSTLAARPLQSDQAGDPDAGVG